MSHASLPYRDLPAALARLDARDLGYQFDLEADICWDRLDEPGLYFPPEFLRALGVDVDTLIGHPEAWEMFQWAAALLSVEGFILTEKDVLHFFDACPDLLAHESNHLLADEEVKHIAMFRRFAEHLREQHPEWTFDFDRLFEDLACGPVAMDLLAGLDEPELRHLGFWTAMVYFEEVTVYMHARLTRSDGVQPCWAAMHEAHMREEVQHLRTDVVHLDAVRVDDAQRLIGARMFQPFIASGLDRAFATRVAEAMVREQFPELPLAPTRPPEETDVYLDIVERHPVFRRTRTVLARLRDGLRPAPDAPPTSSTPAPASAPDIERWLVTRIAEVLERPPSEIDPAGDLQHLALDSLQVTELAAELSEWLGCDVPATALWDHPTIRALAAHLALQEGSA